MAMSARSSLIPLGLLLVMIAWGGACNKPSKAAAQSLDSLVCSPSSELYRLVFAGDIMMHGPQIKAGASPQGYNFSRCFDSVRSVISAADLALGNLETTFGGKPYTGYPMFSSPDQLGQALRDAGFDMLTTSNNHSADRSARGIVRTLDVLDSLGLAHTGSYRSAQERERVSPLIQQLGSIRLAIMAYTYGTNGLSVPKPTLVDRIDTALIARDLERADSLGANYTIVQIHWGDEYAREPNAEQQSLARWLHERGVDAIIGSHPHVAQRSAWLGDSTAREHRTLVVYSLGNFISNQRSPVATRGGLLLSLTLRRDHAQGSIETTPSYRYVFVQKTHPTQGVVYRLLPVELSTCSIGDTLLPHERAELQAFCRYYSSIPLVQ